MFQVDIDRVVKAAQEYGKLIEINNGSFRVRKGSFENCLEFVRKCRKYGVSVTCGTDAHICYDIGKFSKVLEILEEDRCPKNLCCAHPWKRSRISSAGGKPPGKRQCRR